MYLKVKLKFFIFLVLKFSNDFKIIIVLVSISKKIFKNGNNHTIVKKKFGLHWFQFLIKYIDSIKYLDVFE